MTAQDFKNKIYSILESMTTDQVVEMTRKLSDDKRDEASDVLEVVLMYLEEKLDEKTFLDLCDDLVR